MLAEQFKMSNMGLMDRTHVKSLHFKSTAIQMNKNITFFFQSIQNHSRRFGNQRITDPKVFRTQSLPFWCLTVTFIYFTFKQINLYHNNKAIHNLEPSLWYRPKSNVSKVFAAEMRGLPKVVYYSQNIGL